MHLLFFVYNFGANIGLYSIQCLRTYTIDITRLFILTTFFDERTYSLNQQQQTIKNPRVPTGCCYQLDMHTTLLCVFSKLTFQLTR